MKSLTPIILQFWNFDETHVDYNTQKCFHFVSLTSVHVFQIEYLDMFFIAEILAAYLFVSDTIFLIGFSVKNNWKNWRGVLQNTGICGPVTLLPVVKSIIGQ